MNELDIMAFSHEVRRKVLQNMFVESMEREFGIIEVTTERQAKNGTRAFLTPSNDTIISYKSGYVRKFDRTGQIYQINKKYITNKRLTVLKGTKLQTVKFKSTVRELIIDPLARMLYIVEFCKRNNLLTNK